MGETLGWFSKETLDSFYNIKSKSLSKFPSMWDFFSHNLPLEDFDEINQIFTLCFILCLHIACSSDKLQ